MVELESVVDLGVQWTANVPNDLLAAHLTWSRLHHGLARPRGAADVSATPRGRKARAPITG